VKKSFIILSLALAPALASAQGLEKNIELLRSNLRTEKVALLTEALALTDAEGAKFWPIHREYETELAKLQDARLAMIKDYAQNIATMDDAKATALMAQAFKIQDQRAALLRNYADKVTKGVSPRVAVRFAQVESFVRALLDVQIGSELPLMP
jgi:hypothetical protein